MLIKDKDKKICEKYSTRDKDGFVHCRDCPLVVDRTNCLCKSFMHYDRHKRKWVPDGKE